MLIKNATIIDGSGSKKFIGDILFRNNKIEKIGNIDNKVDKNVLNAEGLYVSPGFIDILNHSDSYLTLFDNASQESLLQQGITTVLMGNCGSSLAPLTDGTFINSIQKWGDTSKINVNWSSFKEFVEELKQHRFGVNIASLIGHSTLRRALAGDDPRKLTSNELKALQYLIEKSFDEGSFGISTGLAYTHAKHTTIDELIFISKIVKSKNALYATHIRDEAENFESAITEALSVAKKTGANTEISHFKTVDKKSWDKFLLALSSVEKLKNVNFDVYPYLTTATVLYTLLPAWASKGGNKSLFNNIKNPETKDKLIKEMKGDNYDYGNIIIAQGRIDTSYVGKKIKEIAKNQNTSVEGAVLNLILASGNRLTVFTRSIDENNLILALQSKKSFLGVDSVGYRTLDARGGYLVHPRYFGATAKFLDKYVKRLNVLSWEEAIHKLTQGPAEKIGLKNRGKIDKESIADLVIFDPNIIKSRATFKNPYNYPLGIKYVFVNGKMAVKNGEVLENAGEVLTK